MAPSVAKYRRSLGIVHQELEQWKEALDAFELANDKEPLNVQVSMVMTVVVDRWFYMRRS